MKILVLDSHACAAVPMIDVLRELGHEVIKAFNINDANSYWQENSNFDCLIVDITGPVDGLTEEEIEQTQEGWISGWIWLQNYLLAENPDFASRVIIYSTRETMQTLQKAEPASNEKVRIIFSQSSIISDEKDPAVARKIKVVLKGAGCAELLLAALEQIRELKTA
jgi:CheY-like chemotaxis protein